MDVGSNPTGSTNWKDVRVWFIVIASKAVDPSQGPGVRIPLLPPNALLVKLDITRVF